MISRNHWANTITAARIFGVGLIFWLTPFVSRRVQIITIIIYTIISLTDLLDGWVARKFKTESDFGKILDPLADKILVLVFLPLLEMQIIKSFPVFIILAREFSVMALRVVAAKRGLIIGAKFSGKLKTIITLPVCGILLGTVPTVIDRPLEPIFYPLNIAIDWVQSWPQWFVLSLVWGVVVVTVWSFFDYLKEFIISNQKGKEVAQTRQNILAILPNIITFFNLILGFFAIFFGIKGRLDLTILFVFLGIYLDGYDGKLARKLNVQSSFGAKLDSRADYVTFGIAPAIGIVVFLLNLKVMTGQQWTQIWMPFVPALIYYMAVHYRLYRFNKGSHADFFVGLPSPVGAVWVIFILFSPLFHSVVMFSTAIMLISVLMVSRLPYPHVSIAFSYSMYKWLKTPALISGNCAIIMLFLEKGMFMMAFNALFLAIVTSYMLFPLFEKMGLLKR